MAVDLWKESKIADHKSRKMLFIHLNPQKNSHHKIRTIAALSSLYTDVN